MSQKTIERRFKVGSPARLKLNNIRGSVDIQTGESGVIAVTGVMHQGSGCEDHTKIVIEQMDDGQVVVKTDYQNSVTNWFGINKPCKIDYTVQVPKVCDVRVAGVSCNISVRSLNGTIDINSVSGGLSLYELSGSLIFGTVSGSIKAEKLSGNLDANSVSGKIRVIESELSESRVKTVSGGIVMQTPLGKGPYTFKGVSGKAVLVVPEDTACSARFHSVSGRMQTSLPISEDHRHGSRGSMEIQGGGVEVSYHCVSGSFKIVTAENEKIVEQKQTIEQASQTPEQMKILEKIERGEITVEEALKELNI